MAVLYEDYDVRRRRLDDTVQAIQKRSEGIRQEYARKRLSGLRSRTKAERFGSLQLPPPSAQQTLAPRRTTGQLERQELQDNERYGTPTDIGPGRAQIIERARAREASTATPMEELGLEARRAQRIDPLIAVREGLEALDVPRREIGLPIARRVIPGDVPVEALLPAIPGVGLPLTGAALASRALGGPSGEVPEKTAEEALSYGLDPLNFVPVLGEPKLVTTPVRAGLRAVAGQAGRAALEETGRGGLRGVLAAERGAIGLGPREAVIPQGFTRIEAETPFYTAKAGGINIDIHPIGETIGVDITRATGTKADVGELRTALAKITEVAEANPQKLMRANVQNPRLAALMEKAGVPRSRTGDFVFGAQDLPTTPGAPRPAGGQPPPPAGAPPEPPRPPTGGEPPIPPEEDPIRKLTDWLNESKGALAKGRKARQAQVAELRSRQAAALQEVRQRPDLTPQQRVEEGMRALQGTAGTTGIGSPPINESQVGGLLNRIDAHPIWQNRPFKAQNAKLGLLKLLNGDLPGQYELGLLEQVFGSELVRSAAASSGSAWREFGAAIGLPRTVRTILDVSWPLRQGIGVLPRHFKEVGGNLPRSIVALFSEKSFQQWDEANRLKPGIVSIIGDDGVAKTWTIGELQDEVDLFLPRADEVVAPLGERTEEFLATQGRDTWVGRIFGPLARPFQRNFLGYGNAVRSDIFENTLRSRFWKGATMEDARALAWLLNVGTGRGDLGQLNRYAAFLSGPIFSPRLAAARVEHALSPLLLSTGAAGVPRSAKAASLAAQQLVTFIGGGIALAAIGSQVPGIRSESNPLSSKWGKLELGFDPDNPLKETTKIDLFGGYQQYGRVIAQLYTAKAKSDTGEIYDKDRWNIFKQFVRNKASPQAGTIWDVLAGETGVGEKIDLKTAAGIRTFLWNEFSPLSFNDIVEAVNRDDGIRPEYGLLAPISASGGGVQTYGGRPDSVVHNLPKYEGIPREAEKELESFLDEVEFEYQRARAAGATVTKAQVAEILGQGTQRADLGRVAAQALRNKLPLNRERIQFAIDHQDELDAGTLRFAVPDDILRAYLTPDNFERVFRPE